MIVYDNTQEFVENQIKVVKQAKPGLPREDSLVHLVGLQELQDMLYFELLLKIQTINAEILSAT